LAELFRIDDHGAALRFVDALFAERHWMRHPYAWGVRQTFRRPAMRALIERARDEAFLRPDELTGLPMPVQLLWGGAEAILPARHLEFFRRHLPPAADIVSPEDYGHAPFLDRSDDLALRILRFAEEARRRTVRERAVATAA
ncbi:MAG: hypothetical protein AAGA56_08620, partial [Myxococcota bacterium]